MSHLGEEAEAFFQEGDAGTYDGGPRSGIPSARDVDFDEVELATELTSEQIERRGRLKRLVSTIVAACGATVLLLVPLRLRSSHDTTQAALPPAKPVVVGHALQAAPLPVAPELAPPVEPPTVTAIPADSPAVVLAPTTLEITKTHAAPGHRARKARTAARTTRRQVSRAPQSTNASAPAPRPRNPSLHLPPTANFPD